MAAATRCSNREHDVVHDGLEHFLSAAAEGIYYLALFKSVLFKVSHGSLAADDVCADACLPGSVTIFNELVNSAVLNKLESDLVTKCECIHTCNVAVKDILTGVGASSCLCIEVETAVGETACLDNFIHAESCIIYICGELVGIPAKKRIALVCVNRTEYAVVSCNSQFMLEGVLMTIEEHGQNGSIYVSDLAAAVKQPLPAVSRALRQLEQDGLIERITDPNDRRKTLVRPTEKGLDASRQVETAISRYFERVICRIPEEQREQLFSLTGVLLEAVEAENAELQAKLKGENENG